MAGGSRSHLNGVFPIAVREKAKEHIERYSAAEQSDRCASEEAPSGNGVKPSAQVEEEFVLGVIQ